MPQLTDKTRISHKKLNQIRVTGGYGTYKYYTLKNTFRPLHIFPNMFHTKPTIEKNNPDVNSWLYLTWGIYYPAPVIVIHVDISNMMGNGFISLKHTTFGGESSSGKLEDTKGVTRSRKSKKDRQQNAQEKKNKRTNNDLQNSSNKTKDWATRTALKIGGEGMCTRRVSSFCSTCGTRRVTVVFTYSNLIYIIDRYRLVSHITLGKYGWQLLIMLYVVLTMSRVSMVNLI